ncbi:MAG: hypothetical protein MJZ97_07180 [Bacteroidales bacterium]|nr:hypothetical protein [Bacteroidales bacterium]
MKLKHLILFLAVVLAACSSRHPVETRFIASQNQQLQDIDSLLWQQPDSALMVLVDFAAFPKADSLSTFDGHYFQILLSELLYKNDCEQTNREKLLKAVDYFDSLTIVLNGNPQPRSRHCGLGPQSPGQNDNLVFLDVRAHYINGVGFYERDCVVEACTEYLKAVEIMESHYKTENLSDKKAQFVGLTFNRLYRLFSDQYMSEPAIGCAQQALAFFRIAPLSAYSVPITLSKIGVEYAALEEIDSMKYYYAQALSLMPDTANIYYRDLRSSWALNDYLYHQKGDAALQTLKRMAAEADDDDERLTRYLTIGDLYYRESLYDSALRYLQPVFDNKSGLEIKLQTADRLSEIYGGLGEHEKEEAYIRFMARYKSIGVDNKSETSKLSTLYQDYANRKQQRLAEAEHAKHIKKTVGIIVTAAVFVALGIVVVAKRRSRKLLRQEMEKQRQAHQAQQNALSGRLKQSNQEIRELKEQIKQQDNLSAKAEAAPTFAEEPICRLIVERVNEGQFKAKVDYSVYKDSALDKQQLLDLRLAADRHFNQFTVRLKQAYPKLTNGDLDYCCLYLLGLSDADIAALMQRAYNTVTERSTKLRNVFGSENNISNTLRGLAESFLLN